MNKEQKDLQSCLILVEKKAKLGPSENWSQREYEEISKLIREDSGTLLSVSTLRRIWKLQIHKRPQKSTLDALAQFIGFPGYFEFLRSLESEEETEVDPWLVNLTRFVKENIKLVIPYTILAIVLVSSITTFLLMRRDKGYNISTNYPVELASQSPEDIIYTLIDYISVEPGGLPDLSGIEDLFTPDPSILLRGSDNTMVKYSVNEFTASLLSFLESDAVSTIGFRDEIIAIETREYKDIAIICIRLQGFLTGRTNPTTDGYDSYHLIKTSEGWKISSIVGESYDKEIDIPTKN